MKYALSIVLLLSISISSFAQNASTTTNGIIENHLYRSTNNGQGRGYYEGHQLITKTVFLNKLNAVPEAATLYKGGTTLKTVGLISYGIGFAIVLSSVKVILNESVNSALSLPHDAGALRKGGQIFLTGSIIGSTGLVCFVTGILRQKKSLLAYNTSFNNKVNLGFSLHNNGVGLHIRF